MMIHPSIKRSCLLSGMLADGGEGKRQEAKGKSPLYPCQISSSKRFLFRQELRVAFSQGPKRVYFSVVSLVDSLGFSRFFSGGPSSIDFIPPLKFLIAFPKPDPISGNRLAPKSTKTMARIMTSSCVPSPNKVPTSSFL